MMFGILLNFLKKQNRLVEIPPLLRAINLVCFNTQRTKLRKKEMKNISYASTVGSLIEQKISSSHIGDLII
ncbi:hypothetical protein CK203_061437 [Vitis vinifera]|uniref:Uncharacterized protein n=1 Tax=Vitis vinifera TaxID=29760 RepID=A0A438GFA3_VITVI|nr:hypothetical protein CK203_061437 [Vitis vinifera]